MAATWKTVHVFISSTFRDMHAERDYLVRFVFPHLREQLLPRRIHLVDVDLRWGVTSQQDAVEVCREIITECRPRFLCMLGGRYGTIPEGGEHSITADEVHFGVLDAHRERTYGLFYFRHGAVTEKMDKSSPGFMREPRRSEKAAKLARLKREIRRANCKPFLYRPQWNADETRLLDLKAFGDRVARDILATIEDEFGKEPPEPVDEFAEDNAAMEAFVEDRSQRFVLGSRDAVAKELLAHARATEGNGYLCVTGAPGSGKSALLAHVDRLLAADLQPILVIRHFTGASPASTDVRRVLRRLCHELKAGCPEITAAIPDDPDKLRLALSDFLRQSCARRHVVVLLDAVDQLDPAPHLAGLRWLPEELPAGVRIILSALDSPALAQLRGRRCPPREIELQPLTAADAEEIIGHFLDRYKKAMTSAQREALQAKTDADKPLYLLAALEELRTLGTYEQMSQRIADLPPATEELFVWILQRLEDDDVLRDAAGGRLVAGFAACLGVSRHGLSERELADLLDPGDPRGNVAALLRLLRPYLARRGELLDFYHRQFRDAATKAWLGTDDQRRAAHEQVARVLQGAPLQRQVSERVFHLRGAGDRDGLKTELSRLDLLDWAVNDSCKYEWLDHWRWLEGHADPANCYASSLDRVKREEGESARLAALMSKVAGLLSEMGRRAAAFELGERALAISKRVNGESHPATAHLVGQLAHGAFNLGKYAEAKSYYGQLLKLDARLPMTYAEDKAAHLSAYGVVLQRLDQYDRALDTYRRALQICETAVGPEHASLAHHLQNLAGALRDAGQLGEAEQTYRRAMRIFEATAPGTPNHAACLSNLALLYKAQAEYSKAMPLLERALEIDTQLFGHDHPTLAIRFSHLGACFADQRQYAEAQTHYEEALRLCEGPDASPANRATVMVNLALVLVAREQYSRAETLLTTALAIDEQVFGKGHSELAGDWNALGTLYDATDRPDKALASYERARQILERSHPGSIELAKTLHNLGKLYAIRNDLAHAQRSYEAALRIKSAVLAPGHPSRTATELALEALATEKRGEPASVGFLEKAVQSLKAAPHPVGEELTDAMSSLGIEYYRRGRLVDAERVLQEALDIDRRRQTAPSYPVARDLASLAVVYRATGREDACVRAREEAAQMLQEIAPQSFQLAGLLVSLGHSYAARDDYASAIAAWERAATIQEFLSTRGDQPQRDAERSSLATTLVNLATLCCEQGRLKEARRFAARAEAVLRRGPQPNPQLAQQLRTIRAECGEGPGEDDPTT